MSSPVNSTVIGGALLPHAPQFFTLPPTEDRATVERVRATAAQIGTRLQAMQPDLWLVFANDHAEQFFLHSAPPFTVHVGGEARGAFAGREFHWRVPGEIGFAIVRALYEQGFDPAFTSTARIDYAIGIPLSHLGVSDPVLPIWVNAYLPPQPRIERCYAFGEALRRIVTALGLKTAVIASGGMSHFPGTGRYAEPDLDFDKTLLKRLGAGNLRALLAYDEAALDMSGNVELRCWACAAGMLGERTPDILELEPSWHHDYASLGFFGMQAPAPPPHYPATKPERVALSEALHALAHDAESRARFIADPDEFAAERGLSRKEQAALSALDGKRMVALGIHPLLVFLARLAVDRERASD